MVHRPRREDVVGVADDLHRKGIPQRVQPAKRQRANIAWDAEHDRVADTQRTAHCGPDLPRATDVFGRPDVVRQCSEGHARTVGPVPLSLETRNVADPCDTVHVIEHLEIPLPERPRALYLRPHRAVSETEKPVFERDADSHEFWRETADQVVPSASSPRQCQPRRLTRTT